jgi:RimJ/RimL family protein N-acetyltransferase
MTPAEIALRGGRVVTIATLGAATSWSGPAPFPREVSIVPDAGFASLTSARLELRRFSVDDLDAFVAYRNEPEVARYQSWLAPYPLEDGRDLIEQLQRYEPDTAGEWFQFAVSPRGGGPLLGDCAMLVLPEEPRHAEIGFTFATEHQGRGYATEAVVRLLEYLLVERGKHRVAASCDDRNLRSAALLERVGMRREAHLIESSWWNGEWTSDLCYAILQREWLTRKRTAGQPAMPRR